MEFLQAFLKQFIHYAQELWWILAIGFFLSGLFYKLIPSKFVEQHLGEPGLKPILLASVVGVVLPVCCLGSLPIAVTLKRKGASLGAVLAFLVATPATSISALAVCWKLLGIVFTGYIAFSVIVMAIVLGFLSSGLKVDSKLDQPEKKDDCCHEDKSTEHNKQSFSEKFKEAMHYGFVKLPKDIGVEIIIGISLASFITVFEPLQNFITENLVGMVGYAFVLVFGLLTYVCSTASVPMADALIQSGLTQGQALCYLIVGPVTSYGTILVIKKDFGLKVLILYLGVIVAFSVLFGFIFDSLL